ncbi:thiamine pyrophosphate-requiring protein [Haloarchaeobius litoreus]|uniref:Thiamine pyrophosphate-requiring protein n=1 Tax=Haloarchaeobius litoreus TaxID=755306 RepID=A0ABD6DNC7_9EURY|nr:thiamine pyrophosphate-requiring protein [Haloarchaeobius litoreus]
MDVPREPPAESAESSTTSAAERLLRAWREHGVEYVFANLGTDHAPLLEAMARLRSAGESDAMPSVVVCPHEFVAMSAAHGYTAVTGTPQVVLVHVDVGTQNLGAAMHNAHRANVPVFVAAGLAPVTDSGYLGSRNHFVHYHQDVFDQPGIVREYCRWTDEYRPPADPADLVARGLERAQDAPAGPVYVTATREALEARFDDGELDELRDVTSAGEPGPSAESVAKLADAVSAAEAPVVITGGTCDPERLVTFAEATGAGVVEHASTRVGFPRDHPQHLGFDPAPTFERADLVVLASVEVPWIPSRGEPTPETTVVQIDPEPTKRTFPVWNFAVDERVAADPGETFDRLVEALDGEQAAGFAFAELAEQRRAERAATLESHRDAGALTPEVATDVVNGVVDESTIVVEDAVTAMGALREHLDVPVGDGMLSKGGAGLGWAGGAAVGAKLARPDARVVSIVGDGSYLFTHPAISAWLSAAVGAPTLTVIYDNGGWNAVERATLSQYPEGVVENDGLPERTFDPAPALTAPAGIVDAHTAVAENEAALAACLDDAVAAVDDGSPAVVHVRLDERP